MLAGLGLSGCAAVGPDYVPPATGAPAGWAWLDPAAQPVAHAAASGDPGQWGRSLNDPLLSELIAEALQASPDLRSAQAKLREARARRTVAAAGQYPGVAASGTPSPSRAPG